MPRYDRPMLELDVRVLPPPKVSMRLMRDAHCSAAKALQAMHAFAVLHSESRLAALRRSGIEFICEPLLEERVNGWDPSREAFFVRWICTPPFQLPALYGVVSAVPNGLTTTVILDATYEPDTGIVGALFDRCVGRRFAKGAVAAFFSRLLSFVEQEVGLNSLLARLLDGGLSTGRER